MHCKNYSKNCIVVPTILLNVALVIFFFFKSAMGIDKKKFFYTSSSSTLCLRPIEAKFQASGVK